MTDVISLDAFRARSTAVAVESPDATEIQTAAKLQIVGDTIELEIDALDEIIVLEAGLAAAIGACLCDMARAVRARQRRDADNAKRDHVPTADRRGRKLPALKLRGWAIDTLGGSPTSEDPRWVRMTRPFPTRLEAERVRREYFVYGYAEAQVRVVPVDHRGRVIPPERMPTEAQ